MKSILVIGADSGLGQSACAELGESFNLVTDSCTFGVSDALRRGQLLDQMRRFGPFAAILICLDVHVRREVTYAVDVLFDIATLPWLALSVAHELKQSSEAPHYFVVSPTSPIHGLFDGRPAEQSLASSIVSMSVERLRAQAAEYGGAQLHQCGGVDAAALCVRTVLQS
jgi:hypothetical protein